MGTPYRLRSHDGPYGSGTASSQDLDILDVYMQEVERYPLLTVAAERTLAQRKVAGQPHCYDVEGKLVPAVGPWTRDGHAALEALIHHNLRLGIACASDFVGRGLALADLIQFANIGLMRAAIRYDPGRGLHFSTIATHWMRQAIARGINSDARTIRIPDYIVAFDSIVYNVRSQWLQEQGRAPSDRELLAAIDARDTAEYIKTYGERPTKARILAQRKERRLAYARWQQRPQQPVSIEQRAATDEADGSLEATLADPRSDTAAAIEQDERHLDVVRALQRYVSERQAIVLAYRFGLVDGDPRTHVEIAAELQRIYGGRRLSRERIRQIQEQALEKLRSIGLADVTSVLRYTVEQTPSEHSNKQSKRPGTNAASDDQSESVAEPAAHTHERPTTEYASPFASRQLALLDGGVAIPPSPVSATKRNTTGGSAASPRRRKSA